DVVMHVGIATPEGEFPLDEIEIFRVPRGTMAVIRPGVWHHAVFADGSECVNTLIVLPERTYVNDCIVVELEEKDQIKITEK
ncbi:MAG: ureidoglycolate hydrolase, partial [Halanaerobiales bacterium]